MAIANTEAGLRPPDEASAGAEPRGARRLTTLAIGAVLALVTLPALDVLPGNGVDFSWAAALHMAAERRLQYGSEIVFTYGPLGFLSLPIPYFGATWALSVAYIVGLQVVTCTSSPHSAAC